MDGQSSVSAAFRGMVMLGGLIAIPAVALFGTGLSETVKQLVQRQFGITSVSSAASISEAPLFVSAGSPGAVPVLAPPVVTLPAEAQQALVPLAAPTAVCPLPAATAFVPPAAAEIPPVAQPNVVPVVDLSGSTGQIIRSIYENPPNLVPVARRVGPDDRPARDVRPLLALQETGGTQRTASPDRFAALEARLRELGSTYCLLESWGGGSQLYRFYCKMGIRGSINFTRSFEATDPDPVGALSKVVQQVEEWRSTAQGNP